MMVLLAISLYFGAKFSLGIVCIIGFLTIHEILVNFLKQKKFTKNYVILQSSFAIPFVLFNYFFYTTQLASLLISISVIINVLLIVYLFYLDIESDFVVKFSRKYSFIVPTLILFPLFALSAVLQHGEWLPLVAILLLVNFGMDTGAWFFGKKFGKHKLWPAVSPNKTLEGFIGGAFTSGFLGGICWHLLFGDMKVSLFFLFVFLGVMSQVGDLIQSKFKRQFGIKDSSALIPGHGGVYDRIDSLIFLTPFFATALKYYNIV